MSKYRVKRVTRAYYVSERRKFNDSFADLHRQFRNLRRQAAYLIRDRSYISNLALSKLELRFEKNENTERTTGLLPTCQSNISDSLENFYFLSHEWIVERADILILRNFRTSDLISSTSKFKNSFSKMSARDIFLELECISQSLFQPCFKKRMTHVPL